MKTKLKLKNIKLYLIFLAVFVISLGLHETKIPLIYDHISNFAITGAILSFSLFYDLHRGTLTKLSFFGALVFWGIVNIIMEFFVRLQTLSLPGVSFINFNTPDPLDALFGLMAILLFYIVVIQYCTQQPKD
jgi:hypothetical protein